VPFLEVNGLDLHYERYGSGPPLLNISGSGADLRNAVADRSPLNKAFDVIHYDQRGLGQTSIPDGPYTMADYADDAAAVMDAVGWETANVIGTSFGGMVALNMALRHGRRISKLVLNCTSPGGLLPSFPLEQLEKMDTEAAIEMKLGLFDSRWNPGADDPIPGLGKIYDQMIQRMRQEPTPEAQRGYHLQLEARSHHDVLQQLHHIDCPTLVCAGEFDDQAPLPNSMAIVDGINNARLKVFQGGHLFLIQDRSAFGYIIDFLEGSS
jgi:3-oxoadipate enol-lactonase